MKLPDLMVVVIHAYIADSYNTSAFKAVKWDGQGNFCNAEPCFIFGKFFRFTLDNRVTRFQTKMGLVTVSRTSCMKTRSCSLLNVVFRPILKKVAWDPEANETKLQRCQIIPRSCCTIAPAMVFRYPRFFRSCRCPNTLERCLDVTIMFGC